MTKKRSLIIVGIIVALVILLGVLVPQRFAARYEVNVRSQIDNYLEDKKSRQTEIETIVQKGTNSSEEEDQRLHRLMSAEIKAAQDLMNAKYKLLLSSLLGWHPAYEKPLQVHRELQKLATESRHLYQTSDTVNAYLEKRIDINKRISSNPLETAEHRQQMIDDYKNMVATNHENNLLQDSTTKESIAAKLAVDTRYLELWTKYPAMYEQGDNQAIDHLNDQILANDQEKGKANELIDKMVARINQEIKVNYENIKKLRDSI